MANELKTINLPGIGRYEISGSGGASSFAELTDTDFTNLQNGQVPVYNSTTEKWENGDDGSSLPTGGTQGQVLTKASATDYDVNWTTPSSGGVGKDLTGQSVTPTPSSTVTAGTNAEIFNDYRDRTFDGTIIRTGNVASGNYSHAEGQNTTAIGVQSHAEGHVTTASGSSSHAEGYHTTASHQYSHAEGIYTVANGYSAHAEGSYTKTNYSNQHVQGKYNNNKSTTLFEIGNGTADNARSNAFEVYQDGSLSQDNGSTKFKFTQVNGSDGYYDASDNFHTFSGDTASSISYDNTTSGLTATNLQSAIDEIVDNIGDVETLLASL